MRSFWIILFFPCLIFASDCKNLPWVNSPVTSEEGEWFFFSGNSADMDLEYSVVKAKGMALDRVINNCESIPKNTKFFRVCKQRIGAGFLSVVQAGVYKGDCFQIKQAKPEEKKILASKELNAEYNYYLNQILLKLEPVNYECSPSETKLCFDKGSYFFNLGIYPQALEYLEYACEAQNLKACFLGGFASFLVKEQNSSLSLFRKTCNQNDSGGCLFLGFDYGMIKNFKLAKTNFQKSCFLDNSRGCLFLGELADLQKNAKSAFRYYYDSCLMNSGEACEKMYGKLSRHPEASEIFGHKACILKQGETCFGMGLRKLESKKYQEALKFFKRSCDFDESVGCRQIAELVRTKSLPKSIGFYNRGCDLGDLQSCLTLRGIFKSDSQKNGYYSMMGCVLGDLDSCFLWGKYLLDTNDIPVAKRVLNNACEKGQSQACELGKKI